MLPQNGRAHWNDPRGHALQAHQVLQRHLVLVVNSVCFLNPSRTVRDFVAQGGKKTSFTVLSRSYSKRVWHFGYLSDTRHLKSNGMGQSDFKPKGMGQRALKPKGVGLAALESSDGSFEQKGTPLWGA